MHVLVTGAGGMLGRALVATLGPRAMGVTHAELDIGNLEAVRAVVKRSRPDAIVNAAAYTDVDGAESAKDAAYAVNATGPQNLAVVAAEAGAFLIHISTDFVFDGTLGRAYREDDTPNPICVYAASKLEGERRVLATNEGAAVARTAWVYGAGHRTFLSQILSVARAGKPLRVVTDQAGSPTWAHDLAGGIIQLLHTPTPGLFHVAGGGVATRFEFAQAIVKAAGLDPSIVAKARTGEFPPRPAQRPAYAPLESARWIEHGFTPLRGWRDALTEAIRDFM